MEIKKTSNIQWVTKDFILFKLGLTAETIDIIHTIITELNVSKNVLTQEDSLDDNLRIQRLEQLFAYLFS